MNNIVFYKKDGTLLFRSATESEVSNYGMFIEDIADGAMVDRVDVSNPNSPKVVLHYERQEDTDV